MKNWLRSIALVGLCATSLSAFAAQAPSQASSNSSGQALLSAFGVHWGHTPAQMEKAGIKLEKLTTLHNIERYKGARMPLDGPGAAQYMLTFGKKVGLYEIDMSSKLFTNDPTAAKGKAFQKAIGDFLLQHGFKSVGHRHHLSGKSPYQCLMDHACKGVWGSAYQRGNVSVGVLLAGNSKDSGFVRVFYVNDDLVTQAQKNFRALSQHK